MGIVRVEVFNRPVAGPDDFLGLVTFDAEVLARIPAPSKHELQSRAGEPAAQVGGKIRVQLINGDQFKLLSARNLKAGQEVYAVVSDARGVLGRSASVSNTRDPVWQNEKFVVPKYAPTPKNIHAVVEDGDLPALLEALTHADWDINTQHHASSNKTLLHKAVEQGNVECLRMLLDAGADYFIRDDDGNTPLELAAAHTQKECSALLSSRVLEDMVEREHLLRLQP